MVSFLNLDKVLVLVLSATKSCFSFKQEINEINSLSFFINELILFILPLSEQRREIHDELVGFALQKGDSLVKFSVYFHAQLHFHVERQLCLEFFHFFVALFVFVLFYHLYYVVV